MSQFKLRENFLPYCLPDITDKEIESMVYTLKSGWIAKGPRTMEFQKKFAESVGAKYAVGVNSCTAALHIALLASKIGPGDEVIAPSMTFAATVNTILHCGATPVFADIDPDTGCIDVKDIERKITSKTKAIVPVHYSGQACDLDAIYALADKYNLIVSEDAAHAVQTFYKGRPIGCKLHNMASYSFYATKNLATGEGGMLVTDDEELYNRAQVLVTHGMSANAWNRYAKGGTWHYDIAEPGFKYNMFDLQAALGLIQLERIEEMQKSRFKIVDMYDKAFSQMPELELQTIPSYSGHSRHLYIIRINPEKLTIDRDDFIDQINARNIGTSVHFIPVHTMSAYVKRGYGDCDLPNTMNWFSRVISLPLYSKLTEADAQYVIDAVADIIEKNRKA